MFHTILLPKSSRVLLLLARPDIGLEQAGQQAVGRGSMTFHLVDKYVPTALVATPRWMLLRVHCQHKGAEMSTYVDGHCEGGNQRVNSKFLSLASNVPLTMLTNLLWTNGRDNVQVGVQCFQCDQITVTSSR